MSSKRTKRSAPPTDEQEYDGPNPELMNWMAAVQEHGDITGDLTLESPEIDRLAIEIAERGAAAEAAIESGIAERIRITVPVIVTVVTKLPEGDAGWCLAAEIEKAANACLRKLRTPEGSREPLMEMIEIFNESEMHAERAEAVLSADGAVFLDHDSAGTDTWQALTYGTIAQQLAELETVTNELTESRQRLTARRDALIRNLTRADVGGTRVSRAASMSTTAVYKIAKAKS